MKIYFKSLLLAAMAATFCGSFTACSDDEDMPASFTTSDGSFAIKYDGLTAEGDRATFSLNATSSWEMTQADPWLTLSETSGSHGSYNLFIIAEENTTNAARRGFIEIRMGSKVQMLTVDQERKTIELSLSTKLLAVNVLGKTEDGSDAKFSITTNSDWAIALPEGCDWIQAAPAEGAQGDTEVTLSVAPNLSGEVRTAKIDVTAADMTRSVTLTQDCEAFTANIPGGLSEFVFGPRGDAASQSIELSCVEAWSVTAKPQWLTVNPDKGPAGKTAVTFTAADNENDAREGQLELSTASGIKLNVKVSQRAGSVPYDNKAVGYAYFSDDMAWAVGGQDQVGSINGSASTTRNIYTWDFAGNGFPDVLGDFQKRYIDLAADQKTVYSADGYLKFGKGGSQTAFQIKPALGIEAGHQANVEVSFRAARNGTDDVTFSVAIEGPGAIVNAANPAGTISHPMQPDINPKGDNQNWRWNSFSVSIKGATAETKIIIGETKYIIDRKVRAGYFRAFVDDIAVKRIAND